jgi:protein ImuA
MEPARLQRAEDLGYSALRQREDIPAVLAALRRHIARIENHEPRLTHAHGRSRPWLPGLPAIDRHLPAQGLARCGLHDIAPVAHGDMPAAMGFALALVLCRLDDPSERRPLLWCRLAGAEREHGRLYGHGFERLGLVRRRLITVTLKKPAGLLWLMEEALKAGALAAVIGDVKVAHADLTATRRLALAARAGKSAALLVFAGPPAATTASQTRWRVAAAASRSPPADDRAPGIPAWTLELTRARSGRPGQWTVEWHHAPHRFALVSGLRGGAIHPLADQKSKPAAAEGPALRAG